MAGQHQIKQSWTKQWETPFTPLACITCGVLMVAVSASSGLLAHTGEPSSAPVLESPSPQASFTSITPSTKAPSPTVQSTPSQKNLSPRVVQNFGNLPG